MEWSAWARAYDPLMRAGWLFVLVACSDSASKQQPAVAEVGGPTAIAAELGDKGYPCRRAVAFMTRDASDAVKERALPLIEQLCATWPPKVRDCLRTAPVEGETKCFEQLEILDRVAFRHARAVAMHGCALITDALADTSWAEWALPGSADPQGVSDVVRSVALQACRAQRWPLELLACFDDSDDDVTCFDKFEPQRTDLAARVAPALAPWRAAASRGAVSCERAAAAAYADRDARKQLAAACTTQAWPELRRACIVAAESSRERASCIDPVQWNEPPLGPPPGSFCPQLEMNLEHELRCDAVTPAITQQVLALVAATCGASLDEHGALSCDDAHAKITALLAALGCAEPR